MKIKLNDLLNEKFLWFPELNLIIELIGVHFLKLNNILKSL